MSIRQQLKDLEQQIKQIKSSTVFIADESEAEKIKRVERLLNNPALFLKYYFPSWAQSDFAPFHLRGFDAVLNFKNKKNIFAWMIARDMAKTTVWQMMGIYLNCRAIKNLEPGYKSCLWWSKTFDQASEMIRAIRLQFEYNSRLKSDFGDFKTVSVWADDKFVTSQGISWRAIGKGQSPRGTKEDERRPDLIIGDDFDDDEEVLNEIRLEKSWQWIMGALWPTMDVSSKSLFVALNNKIGEKSLMARLYEIADYKETINLLDNTGKPSWARHTLADCQYMITKMGTLLAQREYFNNPINEGKVFNKQWIQYKPMQDLSKYMAVVAYLDPSFSSKKNADHKSWILMGLANGELHVIKVFCAVATIEEMVEWGYLIEAHVKKASGSVEFWMEEVFFQSILYKDFHVAAKKKGWPLPLRGDVDKKVDKDQRIMALAGYFERGEWYFNEEEKDNHHFQNLLFQFTSFQPGRTGIKKDGPDACEGAVSKLIQRVQTNSPAEYGKRSRSKNMY